MARACAHLGESVCQELEALLLPSLRVVHRACHGASVSTEARVEVKKSAELRLHGIVPGTARRNA
jgi:hypothetical protein